MTGLILRQKPVLLVAGLLFFAAAAFSTGTRRTLLLVEHADRFVLLNQYQQRLTTGEYRMLPAILPMVLIRENDKLSDGFTRCATVEIDGTMFYLQKDQSGAYVRRGVGGSVTVVREALMLEDTVVLLQGRALRMKAAGNARDVTLASASRAERLFETDGRTFVRVLPAGTPAGWLVLPASARSKEWKTAESSRGQKASAEQVERRLLPVVAGANETLTAVYRTIADKEGRHGTPPSFRLWREATAVRCAIEPQSVARSFDGSLRELLPEFERALLGTGLRPSLEGGMIVVPLR